MHRRSTILPHLFNTPRGAGLRKLPFWAFGLLLLTAVAAPAEGRGAPEVGLYRLFLLDGGTLVSYGEFARVADRVVLSIPVGELTGTPTLQVVSIPQATVDWDRTERYANAVRARRYGETRGEADFALLGARVVEALNQISLTDDPARRLAMATEARHNLMRWPAENFGYRAEDVADLASMLDEVISDLRVAAGETTSVSLVASTVPPRVTMLAPPDLRESMEQAVVVASLAPDPSQRLSLLEAIDAALREPARQGGWAAALAGRVSGELAAELKVEKAYEALAASTLSVAAVRAARGDLRGVQALFERVLQADDRLGRQRPQNTSALLGSLDWQLGEAVRVRQAREAWAARRAAFAQYREAIARPIRELRDARQSLTAIRQRSGPAAPLLPRLEQRFVMGSRMFSAIVPPPELDAAHGLFRAALQMASRAATARRNAVSFKDTKLEWDAASAAAGALMMLDRASEELGRLSAPQTVDHSTNDPAPARARSPRPARPRGARRRAR